MNKNSWFDTLCNATGFIAICIVGIIIMTHLFSFVFGLFSPDYAKDPTWSIQTTDEFTPFIGWKIVSTYPFGDGDKSEGFDANILCDETYDMTFEQNNEVNDLQVKCQKKND